MNFNQDIAFYAFRYALGRKTYVVNDVAKYLIANVENIPREQRDLIIKEIRDAIYHERAGMDVDIADWENVVDMFDGYNFNEEVK